MYHGPAGEMVSHFNAQGYQCEVYDNPADFVLDLLIDASRDSEELTRLRDAYENSTVSATMKTLLTKQSQPDSGIYDCRQPRRTAARSFATETFYVAQRTLRNAIRNPILFLAQILVSIIIGLLIGLVFYDLKKTTEPGAHNRLGAIFFMIVSQIFSAVTAVEPLLKERALFIHVSSKSWSIYSDALFLQLLAGTYQRLLSNRDIFHRQSRVRCPTHASDSIDSLLSDCVFYDGSAKKCRTVLCLLSHHLYGIGIWIGTVFFRCGFYPRF